MATSLLRSGCRSMKRISWPLHAELCERLRQEDIFITRREIELAAQRRR